MKKEITTCDSCGREIPREYPGTLKAIVTEHPSKAQRELDYCCDVTCASRVWKALLEKKQ